MDKTARCAEGRKWIQNKNSGEKKCVGFHCDKSIILSTIQQHSKSPSGTFFVMLWCTALVGRRNWSLLQGVFILTKETAEAQPRISTSGNVLSSFHRVLQPCEQTRCCCVLFPLRRRLCIMDTSVSYNKWQHWKNHHWSMQETKFNCKRLKRQ